jgi:NTP pyrophosphatase (non-canonical NTP hydrolase)
MDKMSNLEDTIDLVRQWGFDKGIIGKDGKATEKTQLYKLVEEVGELVDAVVTDNESEKIDAIGDCTVVLILLSELIGVPFESCLNTAYQVISQRTGKMVGGVFVKDK